MSPPNTLACSVKVYASRGRHLRLIVLTNRALLPTAVHNIAGVGRLLLRYWPRDEDSLKQPDTCHQKIRPLKKR